MPIPFDFSAFPILTTERLLLRELTARDAAAVLAIRGDPEVARHNIGIPYERPEEARRVILEARRRFRSRDEIRWGITLKGESNRIIGLCGFNVIHHHDQYASLGYDLAAAYWGRGLMREAIHAILTFGFERMDLNRIEAEVGEDNIRSLRLLERLGFRYEGTLRERYFEDDAFHDLRVYGLLYRDWSEISRSDAPEETPPSHLSDEI